MSKKTIYFFLQVLCVTFLLQSVVNNIAYSADDSAIITTEAEEKSAVKAQKHKKTTKEIKPDATAKDKKTEAKVDSASPFIYENNDDEQLYCKVTTFIEPEFINKKTIKKGNNLLRKAGGALRAGGSYLQITGVVVDENCLPVQGAVVEIWQADAIGHYEWEYDVDGYWQVPVAGKDNNFLFSGSAHTDNLGQFNFLTIFPGDKNSSAPYINIIVKLSGYEELHTRMYFAGHPRNDSDPIFATLQEGQKKSIIAMGKNIDPQGKYEGRVYYFPITMRGINGYKRF